MTRRLCKGFTVIELVVVMFLIGVALALAILYFPGWVEDYRFSAATRVFINACKAARMRAIRGPISLNISSITSSTGSKTFTLTPIGRPVGAPADVTGFVPFTYGGGAAPTGAALLAALPITTSDYVSLAGFNSPAFLNGNLYSVTAVTLTGTAQPNGTPNQYYATLTFDCQCCDVTNPSQCLQWPASPSPPQKTTTGKARVAACVKFVPTQPTSGSNYGAVTTTAGNSIQCQFDPRFFQIEVNENPDLGGVFVVVDPAGSGKSIAFDFAGFTRNHTTYSVKIKKVKNGVAVLETVAPPVIFTILPTGRIRLGE